MQGQPDAPGPRAMQDLTDDYRALAEACLSAQDELMGLVGDVDRARCHDQIGNFQARLRALDDRMQVFREQGEVSAEARELAKAQDEAQSSVNMFANAVDDRFDPRAHARPLVYPPGGPAGALDAEDLAAGARVGAGAGALGGDSGSEGGADDDSLGDEDLDGLAGTAPGTVVEPSRGLSRGASRVPARGDGPEEGDLARSSLGTRDPPHYTTTVNPQTLNTDIAGLREKLQRIQSVIRPGNRSLEQTSRLRASGVRPAGSALSAPSQIEKARLLAEEMKNQTQQLQRELTAVRAERDELRQARDKAEGEKDALAVEVEDLRRQVFDLEKAADDVKSANATLQSDINDLTGKLADARRDLERERDAHARDVNTLQSDIRKLMSDRKEMARKAMLMEAERRSLQTKADQFDAFDPVSMKAQLDSLGRKFNDALHEAEALRRENERLSRDKEREREELLGTIEIIQLKQASAGLTDDAATEREASEIVNLSRALEEKDRIIEDLRERLRSSRQQYRSAERASQSMIGPVVFSTLRGLGEMSRSTRRRERRRRDDSFGSGASDDEGSYSGSETDESVSVESPRPARRRPARPEPGPAPGDAAGPSDQLMGLQPNFEQTRKVLDQNGSGRAGGSSGRKRGSPGAGGPSPARGEPRPPLPPAALGEDPVGSALEYAKSAISGH